MTTLSFLASLPAVLGITGFVIYQFLGRSQKGDKITQSIVEKLRQRSPQSLSQLPNKLTPKELAARIAEDQKLRSQVDQQDFELLRSALHQQFILSLIVYLLCALLFLVGSSVFAYVTLRPKPLSIGDIHLNSTVAEAEGISVDLDDLRATWAASGEPEEVKVFLQNIETGQRSKEITLRSSDAAVTLSRSDYQRILADRTHLGKNRIRVVLQGSNQSFQSAPFDLLVGTKISVVGFPEKIKIMARIDNEPIPNCDFEAKVLFHLRKPIEPMTVGGFIHYGQNDFPLQFPDRIDWATVRLYYMGPDDHRIVRPEYLGLAEISR
jgi:hypothetical protein